MKIVLTTLNAKFIHSSLALAYLKAYLESGFPDIQIREYTINDLSSRIMADLFATRPDIICFSCYIWNINQIRDLAADLKKVLPGVIIIAGGPEVSYDADTFICQNPGIDFIIRGEGEEALGELLHCLELKQIPSDIAGLIYRHNDEIRENPDRPLLEYLDKIPFPYGEANIRDYHNKTIYYESSRGCPFNCSYCLSSTIRGVRFFSRERVFKDLGFLMEHEVPEVKFVDRTFNCNEKRCREIMKFILEHNVSTKFHFEIMASLLTDDMLAFLQHVPPGIFDFEIGIQSTNPQTLNSIKRHNDWEKEKHNILAIMAGNNIHVHLDLIAGLPYEDYERFKISFNDVYGLKPHVIQLGFLKLLKGSAIRRQSEYHGYIYQNKPPYQVLGNNYIKYDQLLMLGLIEDLIKRYYNTGIVANTLDYLIKHVYLGDAFDFWQEFALFLLKKNFFQSAHKRDREYNFLYDFVVHMADDKTELRELLKFDYLLNNQASLPIFFTRCAPQNINEYLYTYLKDEDFVKINMPVLSRNTPRERRRLVNMEYLYLDQNLTKKAEPLAFIFIYDHRIKRAVSFTTVPFQQII